MLRLGSSTPIRPGRNRWIGSAIVFVTLLGTAAAPAAEITVSAAERRVAIERGYNLQYWTPLNGGLQLFAASKPEYAHLWPTPSTIEDVSTATSGAVVISRDSTQVVDVLSSQTSTISANSITASGDVYCGPGVLFDESQSESYLIFSRCEATALLDVTFSVDADVSYSLRALYWITYTDGTSSVRLRLLDDQGAVIAQLTPTGCIPDPIWPPQGARIYWICPAAEVTTDGYLPAGEYRLELTATADAATEDFYYDPIYSQSWPGWSENGFIDYDVALEVTGGAVQAPVAGAAGTLLMALMIAGSVLQRAASRD
jgi:hypothetical protein